MNTLILTHDQFKNSQEIILNDRQVQHLESVLKSKPGDIVNVGKLNGNMGQARVVNSSDRLSLELLHLDTPPPMQLDFKLILALPRPQMIKRILQTVATFGVNELILIHTARVEKSFWQSPSISDESIYENFLLGLEQAKATQLPRITKYKRFREYIEDYCEAGTEGHTKIIAHPGKYPECPTAKRREKIALAIGPEGGFNEFEVGKFIDTGFQPVQLGERILKVETAVTALIARLI